MVKSQNKKVSTDVLRSLRGTSENERILHRLHSVVLVLNGFSCSEAARLFGDSARSVAYWFKRFETEGVSGLKEELRSGRPTKLMSAQIKQLRTWIEKESRRAEPITAKRVASFINQKFGVRLTVRQCRRIVNTFKEER